MNITDVQKSSLTSIGNRFETIFNYQNELALKYHRIENSKGLLQTQDYPVDLHDSKGQARIKDFAWRITEELAEVMDAMENETGDNHLHVQEELADSFHFLVEMALISGINCNDIAKAAEEESKKYLPKTSHCFLESPDLWETLWIFHSLVPKTRGFVSTKNGKILKFIKQLGMVCHTLKNKPWKQSQVLTDESEYRKRFFKVFLVFIDICIVFGLSSQDMFDLYFKKAQVNAFRQRSMY